MEKHGQLIGRHEPLATFNASSLGILRTRAMHTVGICAGVERVAQDREDPVGRRRPPLEFTDAPSAMAAKSQLQVVHDQVSKDRVRGTEFVELLEHEVNHSTCLLVGLLEDLARGCLEVSQGHRQEQLPAIGFIPAAAKQAVSKRHELIFTHCALHSEEQPIVAVGRIVDAVLVAQKRVEDSTDINELMPIFVGPRQPAEFQPQHDANVVQAHFRHQPLEARAIVSRLATLSLVLVNDDHSFGWPAEPLSELG